MFVYDRGKTNQRRGLSFTCPTLEMKSNEVIVIQKLERWRRGRNTAAHITRKNNSTIEYYALFIGKITLTYNEIDVKCVKNWDAPVPITVSVIWSDTVLMYLYS